MSDILKKPFDGAISAYFRDGAPREVREAIRAAGPDDIIGGDYPYRKRMKSKDYQKAYDRLQIELAKMQMSMRSCGGRMIVVFEGRDAAGKGGAIRRVTANLNPRFARVVALSKPTEAERGEWYFQRYIRRFPTHCELVLFDRSWYNRAVVERVFGFSDEEERERFFLQTPGLERATVSEGIGLVKIWLTVSRAEQLRRFLARESDPLKQWKLSRIDVDSLALWDDYTAAIRDMFGRTHHEAAPWTVIRADDKRRARLEVMRRILLAADYEGKDLKAIGSLDPGITGDPLTIPIA